MTYWVTIYNGKAEPTCRSVECDVDPSPWLGGDCSATGALIFWYIGDAAIILSEERLH